MGHDYLDFDAPDEAVIRAERQGPGVEEEPVVAAKDRLRSLPVNEISYNELTMDHLVPLARGGRSTRTAWCHPARPAIF